MWLWLSWKENYGVEKVHAATPRYTKPSDMEQGLERRKTG